MIYSITNPLKIYINIYHFSNVCVLIPCIIKKNNAKKQIVFLILFVCLKSFLPHHFFQWCVYWNYGLWDITFIIFFGNISTSLFKDWWDRVYRGFSRHLFLATAENGAHHADWKDPPRICWIKSLHLDIIVVPLCWGFLKLLVKQISSI